MNVRDTLQAAIRDTYDILREIGSGGMATVYLARDLRHERQVAVKVLRPELGAVLGVERFLAEIRVTANLQHPHLLPLFDSGEAAGLLYYVMPYIEGESLRHRLQREQQLGIAEAVRIGAAVASALDYAHRHHVVHRDLKPENILLQDGEPVVSDFGIALAVSNAGGARVTQTGLSLGTPAYMSPEQAAGDRVVDARSDVYSLGAVVYEMLIGEPPHTGANVQQVISRVLTERPRSITEQRHTVPAWLDGVVMRSLAKLPADRYATAREFGQALKSGDTQAITTSGRPGGALTERRARSTSWIPWGIAAAAVAFGAWSLSRPAPVNEAPLVRFSVAAPSGVRSEFSDPAISSDGRRLLISEGLQGGRRVWVRGLGDSELTEVVGLGNSHSHFLSPNGGSIGFVADGKIRIQSTRGGPTTTLSAEVEGPFGATPSWGSRGMVIYAGAAERGIWSVDARGGTARRVTIPGQGQDDASPSFLPDGEHFFFERRMGRDTAPQLLVGDLDGSTTPLGALRGSDPRYVSGWLVFSGPEGDLNAVRLTNGLQPTGEPVALLALPVVTRGPRRAAFVASHTGVLAFVEANPRQSELVTVDRRGETRSIENTLRAYSNPALAPVGGAVAVEVGGEDGSSDIYIFDAGGTSRRVTRAGRNHAPTWNHDGSLLLWSTQVEGGTSRVMAQRLDGADPPRVVLETRGLVRPHSVTTAGDSVRAVVLAPRAVPELVTIDLATGGVSRLHSEPGERSAAISPDGRWVAYSASEEGVSQVFLRPAASAGPVLRLSDAGGEQPRWGRDPGSLYYRDSTHMVEVTLTGALQPRVTRTRLFADLFERGGPSSYDVAPGSRFVMLRAGDADTRLEVLVNLATMIRARESAARRAVGRD